MKVCQRGNLFQLKVIERGTEVILTALSVQLQTKALWGVEKETRKMVA